MFNREGLVSPTINYHFEYKQQHFCSGEVENQDKEEGKRKRLRILFLEVILDFSEMKTTFLQDVWTSFLCVWALCPCDFYL